MFARRASAFPADFMSAVRTLYGRTNVLPFDTTQLQYHERCTS